jgi:hypothetical protein
MTYQPNAGHFEAPRARSLEDFAIIRSDWMDAFARFEAAACACLVRFAGTCEARNVPFSQRLSALSSLTPGPHLPKKAKDLLTELAGSCQSLLTMRAAIVHSPMAYGERNALPAAFFQNALDFAQQLPLYVVMTESDFADTKADLTRRTRKLEGLLVSPSSPPQPTPGATAGP